MRKFQTGFTLVELMVVVAIIGLLSAVAVPNFKKYQAKAKVAEAKLQLSALYTAEQAFFSDFNMYHLCLPYMGYDPNPEALNRYYAIMIAAIEFGQINTSAYASAVNSGLNSTDCPDSLGATESAVIGVTSPPNVSAFPAGKGIGSSIAIGGPGGGSMVGHQGDIDHMFFTAYASGIISAGFVNEGVNNSLLEIDQNKKIQVLRVGY